MNLAATLSRYIARRLIVGVGGLFLILTSLVLLIDFIENLRFVGKVDDAGFGFAAALTFLRAPALTESLFPFVFLFGAIWTFHQLNKRSEFAVMRSAGLSVWRLVGPAALVAALVGLFIIAAYDPLASRMNAFAEIAKRGKEGKDDNLVRVLDDGLWLRQRSDSVRLLINARAHDRDANALRDVTVWRFNAENVFEERIDARAATFSDGAMSLRDAALINASGEAAQRTPLYAIATNLRAEDLKERIQPPETLSLWRLPKFMQLAQTAGLPTVRYQMRLHDLTSTPLKMIAMVLIAAAFAMRPIRSGGQGLLVLAAVATGFALYVLAEIAAALGESELAPAALAGWAPSLVASLAAISALIYLEDG